MDQLKAVSKYLLKYYLWFWIVCGLIIVAVIGSWALATHRLQKDVAKRAQEIEDRMKAVEAIRSVALHPNDASHAAMEELEKQVGAKVYEAWDKHYQRQVATLKWPDELPPQVVAAFEPLRPIEAKVDFPTTNEAPTGLREAYRDYIKKELPKLAKIIHANWPVRGETVEGSAPGAGGATDLTPAEKPIVRWDVANQDQLMRRFDWGSGGRPSTLQVLYAQEDLWVLTALLEIIKKTNGDADATYNAPIKEIEYIRIGGAAAGRAGRVERVQAGGGGGSAGESGGAMDAAGAAMAAAPAAGPDEFAASPGAADAAMAGNPGGGEGGTLSDPAQGRYVDNQYLPLSATRLRAAFTSTDPADAFLAVAKRMPVRMRLMMDQRKLNRFLTECGNSSFPVEVRQVRIARGEGGSGGGGGGGGAASDPAAGGAADPAATAPATGAEATPGAGAEAAAGPDPGAADPAAGGGGGGRGFGGGFGGGFGSIVGAGGRAVAGRDTRAQTDDAIPITDSSPFDLPVEIYGILYIYNPVSMERLGVDKAAAAAPAQQPAQPTTEASKPTGAPAAAAEAPTPQ